MYFIDFLQQPTVVSNQENSETFVRAEITIASRPTQSPLPYDITINASLQPANDEDTPYLVESYQWQNGASSLRICLDVSKTDVAWPARVKVAVAGDEEMHDLISDLGFENRTAANGTGTGTGSTDRIPYVFTAWGALLDPLHEVTTARRVERRITLSNDRMLSIWEAAGEVKVPQLRTASVVLLAYLDSVISTKAETIPDLEEQLAAATYKKLNIADVTGSCGIAGIGVAQLIPDCHIVVFDVPGAAGIVEANIYGMVPAMSSGGQFERIVGDSTTNGEMRLETSSYSVHTAAMDLIFVTDDEIGPSSTSAAKRKKMLLTDLLNQSPKAVTAVVGQESQQQQQQQQHTGKNSSTTSISDVLLTNGSSLCGRTNIPSPEEGTDGERGHQNHHQSNSSLLSSFFIDIYRGRSNGYRKDRHHRP